jgi:hypothetical protein
MEFVDPQLNLTYSYLALRKAVGWIGILLPFTMVTGVMLIFRGEAILKSISLYYYSGMRDVFVGAISAIALFLLFYRGYDRVDNWAGNFAGYFALGIAFFPTTKEGPLNWIGIIHLICASAFFIIIAGFSLFLFTRRALRPTKRKLTRNKIYVICGLVIITCLLSIMVFFIFLQNKYPDSCFVFWAETFALIAFGISWLTKGGTLYPDKAN